MTEDKMRKAWTFALFFLIPVLSLAQQGPNRFPPINIYHGNPNGQGCPTSMAIVQSDANGKSYTCFGGVWGPGSEGGVPGGSNLQLQFNNSSAFGGTSAMSVDAATQGYLNLHSPLPDAPPVLDLRSFAFAGGVICDGTKTHPIDSMLQAAINSGGTVGERIQIVGNPSACYLQNPAAIKWTGHGTITILLQGTLNLGTTFTFPRNVLINFNGNNGVSGAQFASPGDGARVSVTPETGNGTGALGTAITPAYTGTGDPTVSAPVVCDSSVAGNIYQDTTADNSIFWTCAKTSGSITSGTNSLTVTNAGGFTGTSSLTVAGAGTSGGTLSCSKISISGTTFTLFQSDGTTPCNAASTVTGATVSSTGDTGTGTGTSNIKFGWVPGAVLTFTPSSMSALSAGAAITVSGSCAFPLATISRTSNVVTATVTPPTGCRLPAGVVGNVAGVSDATFNGTHTTGATAGPYMIQSSDWVTNTVTWTQGAAADVPPSSLGGTVTTLNEANIENAQIANCTLTTCTATFMRPHAATDNWGVVGINFSSNNSASMKDIVISSPGTPLWIPQAYEARFVNVSTSSTSGCGSNPATSIFSPPVDIGYATWTHFDGVAFLGFCEPWSIRMQQGFNIGYANNGPLYLDNSFILPGTKQEYGGMGLFMRNSVCDQCARGVVTTDTSTPYWNGNINQVRIENTWTQDNPNGWKTTWLYQTVPTGSGKAVAELTNIQGATSINSNDYFTGSLKTDSGTYGQSVRTGPVGIRNDGKNFIGNIRGSGADFHPSLVPHSTAHIDQTGATWSGGCTITTGQTGPDQSTNAVMLSGANINTELFGSQTITPTVGDQILFWTWIYTPTADTTATVPGTGSALTINNANSAHYQLGSNTALFSTVGTSQYDSSIGNDRWHFVIGYTTVTFSDGTAAQTLRLTGGCGTTKTLVYFRPNMIYIPTSENITQETVLGWKDLLLHGSVPPDFPAGVLGLAMDSAHKLYWGNDTNIYREAAGTLKTDGNFDIGTAKTYQVNGTQIGTGNLGDWTNAGITNGYVPVWNSSTGKWTPGTGASGGTVTGPVSSVVGHSVTWGNTNGTLIADGGIITPRPTQNPALVEQILTPIFSSTPPAPLTACASQTAAFGTGATSASPMVNQLSSGTTSGNCAGFYAGSGNVAQPDYYQGRNPVVTWGFAFSASGDYTSNARIWIGLIGSGCTIATLTGSDTPSCSYGAIRWSTSASDATWQCVSDSGTGVPQVQAIGSTSPTTAFQTVSVSVVAGSVTCTVGATSVTNSSTVPTNQSLYDVIANTTLTNSATHIRIGPIYGYSANGAF